MIIIVSIIICSCSNITSHGKIELIGNNYYLKNTSYDKIITFTIEKTTIEYHNVLTKVEVKNKKSTEVITLNPGELSKKLTINYEDKDNYRRTKCVIVGEVINPCE